MEENIPENNDRTSVMKLPLPAEKVVKTETEKQCELNGNKNRQPPGSTCPAPSDE